MTRSKAAIKAQKKYRDKLAGRRHLVQLSEAEQKGAETLLQLDDTSISALLRRLLRERLELNDQNANQTR